jgi:hypothetical protein
VNINHASRAQEPLITGLVREVSTNLNFHITPSEAAEPDRRVLGHAGPL